MKGNHEGIRVPRWSFCQCDYWINSRCYIRDVGVVSCHAIGRLGFWPEQSSTGCRDRCSLGFVLGAVVSSRLVLARLPELNGLVIGTDCWQTASANRELDTAGYLYCGYEHSTFPV